MLWDRLARGLYTSELVEVHLNTCMEHSVLYGIMPTSDSAAEPRRRAAHAIHELALHFQMQHKCTIQVVIDVRDPLSWMHVDELLNDSQKQMICLAVARDL